MSRKANLRRLLPWLSGVLLGGAVIVLVVVAPRQRDDAQDRDPAPDPSPANGEITRTVGLSGRGYDLAVLSDGGLLVAQSDGLVRLTPDTFEVAGACASGTSVRRVRLRPEGPTAEYLGPDGRVHACDPSTFRPVKAAPDADEVLRADRQDVVRGHRAWVARGQAWLDPAGSVARRLPTGRDEALAVAIRPDGGALAVTDRAGRVWLYSLPWGKLVRRLDVLSRNVYAVGFSPDGRRIFAVGGALELAIVPL